MITNIKRIKNFLMKIYYELFDQLILYPLISLLPQKYNIKFMNLGFAPVKKSLSYKEQVSNNIIERFSEATQDQKAHCYLYEKTLSLCPIYPQFKEAEILLEVGCGLGGGLEWIKSSHPQLSILHGIDRCISNYSIQQNGINLIKGQAEDLPFPENAIDIVLNVESSHLYIDINRFLKEVKRVLKPGGYLCWADLREKSKMPSVCENMEKICLKQIAFEDITAEIIQGIHQTSAHYDQILKKAPWFIQLFHNTLRRTYCAPGTETYAQYCRREKLYAVGCWQKPHYKNKENNNTIKNS